MTKGALAFSSDARGTAEVVSASGQSAGLTVFSFGDPEPVLDGARFLNHLEVWHNGRYYQPPVNPVTLSRAINIMPHHRSAISLKVNLLVRNFVEHPMLSADVFERFCLDFIVQGNGYLELIRNRMGRAARLDHVLAQQTRVGLNPGEFWWIDEKFQESFWAAGNVFHLRQYDPAQEIYGLPEYLSAFQSMLLNEAATLFRRRYYLNGAHAGFILYINDEGMEPAAIDKIREQMKQAKGPGNFRNLFVHSPKGKDKGVQILPISEVAAKDEFLGIKNTSRDDVLAGWRTPPQIMGVVPANSGGFGDVEKAQAVFFENEIVPLQKRIASGINGFMGQTVVRFDNPAPVPAGGGMRA
jgi:PBSX family phage portal protein